MRRSQRTSSRLNRLGLAAAVIAGALAASVLPAVARHAVLLGPRSLYPATEQLRSRSDIPLVMRDAIQHIVGGTRLLAIGPRIMGGEPAAVGAFPWVASLEFKLQRRRDAHFCGGAFIAPHWVITAAHCVKTGSADAIDVLGGTNTLDTGGALHPVDRVIVNDKYNTDTQDYDVALLHLEKPFAGKTIRLLKPADADRLAAPGSLATSAGWGYTAEGGNVSNVLRRVTVEIVSNQTCNGLAAYAGAVTDRMVCAGFPEGGKDSCQGDSGGPLMVPDGQGGYFLAGVTSWGEGCGRPNKFGVYTRVSTIADWVAGKIGTKGSPTAPVASNAPSNVSPNTAKPELDEDNPAKSGIAGVGPRALRWFGAAPESSLPQRSRPEAAAPVLSMPMPQPRPAARPPHEPRPRLRTKRRMGVPINRGYSPAYPARAQARRTYTVTPARPRATPHRRWRGYNTAPRNNARGFYMPRYNGPTDIPPSFDWRVPR